MFKKLIRLKNRNNLMHASGKKGFTLVEILIVLAMIAIVIAVMVPEFVRIMPRYRLRKAARNLISDMQRTRLNAIKTGQTWQITFNTGAESYQIVRPDATTYPAVSLTDYGSGVNFPASGSCGSATGTWADPPGAINQRASVNFTNRGTCAAGSIYLTNQTNTVCYAITTTAACGIKLRKYNGITPFDRKHWIE